MERLIPGALGVDDGEERFDDAAPAIATNGARGFNVPSVDPTSRYESEDLFEKFYEFLRRPVDDAIERFQTARKNGGAAAERRKLDSLTNKFSRVMSVLSMMGEGYTQEQTAERMGLSRNQVKYIVESVQEAYARFTTDRAHPATRATSASGEFHVD
jgi:DNA-binding NarL/FixJ family response regulator